MTFSCRGKVCGVDWIYSIWVGVGIKKSQGGSWVSKYSCLILFYRFRGVKDKGSEIG